MEFVVQKRVGRDGSGEARRVGGVGDHNDDPGVVAGRCGRHKVRMMGGCLHVDGSLHRPFGEPSEDFDDPFAWAHGGELVRDGGGGAGFGLGVCSCAVVVCGRLCSVHHSCIVRCGAIGGALGGGGVGRGGRRFRRSLAMSNAGGLELGAVVAVAPLLCRPACHPDGVWHRMAGVPRAGVEVAYGGEQLFVLWASGVAQLLGGWARWGVVALGLGGRGGRSGRCELMEDDCLGRLVPVSGEVGGDAAGVAVIFPGALVSCLGVCVVCAGVGYGAILDRLGLRHRCTGLSRLCVVALGRGAMGRGAVGRVLSAPKESASSGGVCVWWRVSRPDRLGGLIWKQEPVQSVLFIIPPLLEMAMYVVEVEL